MLLRYLFYSGTAEDNQQLIVRSPPHIVNPYLFSDSAPFTYNIADGQDRKKEKRAAGVRFDPQADGTGRQTIWHGKAAGTRSSRRAESQTQKEAGQQGFEWRSLGEPGQSRATLPRSSGRDPK